jgi:hypothetical protein
MRAAPLAAVLASLVLPAMAQDVPWFDAHPAQRKAQLDACRRDRSIGMLPVCDNAQTSETNDFLRRRQASDGRMPGVNLPWEPSPLLRETIRRQCAQPLQYRLFPKACGT